MQFLADRDVPLHGRTLRFAPISFVGGTVTDTDRCVYRRAGGANGDPARLPIRADTDLDRYHGFPHSRFRPAEKWDVFLRRITRWIICSP